MPKKLLPVLLSICLLLSACQISSEDEISALQAEIERLQFELDEMRNAEPTAPTEEPSPPAPTEEPSPTPTPSPEPPASPSPNNLPEKEVISGVLFTNDMIMVGVTNPRKMSLCSRTEFTWNDTETVVEMYIDAELDAQGGLLGRDDSEPWSILVRQGKTVYPIVLEKVVYGGELKYYIYEDYFNPEKLIILVFGWTGNGIWIDEYTYDELEKGFIKEKIYYPTGFSFGWSKNHLHMSSEFFLNANE